MEKICTFFRKERPKIMNTILEAVGGTPLVREKEILTNEDTIHINVPRSNWIVFRLNMELSVIFVSDAGILPLSGEGDNGKVPRCMFWDCFCKQKLRWKMWISKCRWFCERPDCFADARNCRTIGAIATGNDRYRTYFREYRHRLNTCLRCKRY